MSLDEEPILELEQIQGNILPGFKKDHQHFTFFTILDPGAAKTWLRALADRISSAKRVFTAHALWKEMRAQNEDAEPKDVQFLFLNVAFTATGLRKLVAPAEVAQFDDGAFRIGMTDERSTLLGDPTDPTDPGTARNWLVGGPSTSPVDFMLISASDSLEWLLASDEQLSSEAKQNGIQRIHQDRGRVRAGSMAGHEHFGFKDGISEPAVRGKVPDGTSFVSPRQLPNGEPFNPLRDIFGSPGQPLVWPGAFLFGYPKQPRDGGPPSSPPLGPSWAKNGSFLVYRRLRQDVDAFAQFLERSAADLAQKHPAAGITSDRLGAMLVGRWKSGTPVARSPVTDLGIDGDGATYFSFSNATTLALPGDTAPLNPSDPDGRVCPLGSHIRKVNPRDDSTDIGPARRSLPRLILRRGITFDESDRSPGDVGLLFVAYQTSITDQFEFLMTNWINTPDRPKNGAGVDPLLAAGQGEPVQVTVADTVESLALPTRFIIPTGGAYFFSPSIDFIRKLS